MFLSDSMGAAHRLCGQIDWQEPPPQQQSPRKGQGCAPQTGPVQPRLTPFRPSSQPDPSFPVRQKPPGPPRAAPPSPSQASSAGQCSHKLPVGGPCSSHGQQLETGCCGQGSEAGRLDGAILSYGGGAGLGSEPAWGSHSARGVVGHEQRRASRCQRAFHKMG